ncbi:MAG: NTP transferase domain-containing protein [Deltaproteobacteria bacterium]|nr:NTP transferase domain-containing protein [Deltaproteobacteria bacterium]
MKHFPLILLAGGNGQRMGTPKGLMRYQGKPWLMHQLELFEATHGHRALIVLGKHHEDYAKAMPWMKTACDATIELGQLHVTVAINEHPEHGQFSSLQCGARILVAEKFSGAYVLPIDVPVPSMEVWSHLRMHMTGDVAACIPESRGRGGHPVLLSHRYLETLLQMPPESRLDVQLQVLPPEKIQRVAVADSNVVLNINTPEQWHKYADEGKP